MASTGRLPGVQHAQWVWVYTGTTGERPTAGAREADTSSSQSWSGDRKSEREGCGPLVYDRLVSTVCEQVRVTVLVGNACVLTMLSLYRHERGVLRPSDSHQLTAAPNGSGTQDVEPEDPGMEDEPPVEYHEPPMNTLTMHTLPHSLMQSYVGPSTLTSRESVTPTVTTATSGIPPVPSTPSTSHLQDQSSVTVNVTNTVLQQYMEFLRTQTQYSRMKLEYLRRREEREERDRMERRELERQRLDREAQNEFEYKKTVALSKEKADRAIQVLGNVAVDATIKQYASDYLKKMFASD